MGQALRINVHPRVITVGEILQRGERDFEELHPRDKELLLRSDVNLDGLVDPQQVAKYQLKKKMESTDSKLKTAVMKAKLALNNG